MNPPMLLLLLLLHFVLQRLIRAYGGMGLTSPSLLAAALSHFPAPGASGGPLLGAPVPCGVPSEAAKAAAMRAVLSAAAEALPEQQQHEPLLRCSTAYAQSLADYEAAAAVATAAAAAADPKGVTTEFQPALVLLQCLLEQQALSRPKLLQLLPTLLRELQRGRQQQQQQLQFCGLVLSACASCELHLVELWEELLSPLLQMPPADDPAPAATAAAAAAAPWGGWLLSRPLLQHVEVAVAAGCFCGVAASGSETKENREELLRAAASAAAHAATLAEGFLALLRRSSSNFSQLTGEALQDLTEDICGLYRAHAAAAALLDLQQQQQQQREACFQLQKEDAPGAAPPAAATQPFRELLTAEFPELQLSQQQKQRGNKHAQQLLQQQQLQLQQQLAQQRSDLLFLLLSEYAWRGTPR
ncbi:hypothetical protein, conserved [Eimeria necatrix]|uniref:Uncharacterized protein n=1 Tax=Eimeria necatrix TaxID=51315 RepID=U6MI60_9EIME|nr:hypothetical protein, conserved [Eimeria necatrix]CDJ62753.1 hypothetical protein, conserved [Eimeria necatrix]